MIEKPFGSTTRPSTEETEHDSASYSIVNAALNGPAVARLPSTSMNSFERLRYSRNLARISEKQAFSIRKRIIAKFYDAAVKRVCVCVCVCERQFVYFLWINIWENSFMNYFPNKNKESLFARILLMYLKSYFLINFESIIYFYKVFIKMTGIFLSEITYINGFLLINIPYLLLFWQK